MALIVEQRPEEDLFVEENPTIYDTPYYTSRFNAANLPLVYKISNTKFPVNTEDVIEDILSVSNNAGFAQLVLDAATYTFLAKETIEVTNTTNYNGVWSIREVIDANNIVINAPFIATETGNVQNYYNNYSTLVKVYSGLPEYHPLNSTKPMTLITDNPITVTPNSDNEAVIDVSALVKSKLSLKNEYDLNDVELFNAFYIEYSEQYDESDGTTVSVTTEAFQQDTIVGCDPSGDDFILNGDFTTNLDNWTNVSTGVDWLYSADNGGEAQVTLSTASRQSKILQQDTIGLTDGTEYDLSFDYNVGANNVAITVRNGSVVYQNSLTGSGTINVRFISEGNQTLAFSYYLNNSPVSPQTLALDNVVLINILTNPCLAYIFSSHSALQPQAKYGGNMGEYVQNFNGGVFANKWLTLMQEPVLFEGNYFDLSTIIPQAVIQSAIQSGGYFLEIVEFDKNGVAIIDTKYPITQNLGDGIYRFRLDDKTFNTNTKKFTAQILRIPVNLFVDGDQGTFDTTISGITSDIESQILRDTTLSFEGAASLRTRSYFDTSDSFIFTAETTSPSETFTLPLISSGAYDFIVDWGDGNVEQITAYNQSEVTHTYSTAGSYDVNMNGIIEGWAFNDLGDKLKITELKQWGQIKFITDATGWFWGCSNMDVTATDTPNLSLTTNMNRAFEGCSSLIGSSSFESWNTGTIQEMRFTFQSATSFNQSLNNWDVSNVTDFEAMFNGCTLFNGNIASWSPSSADNFREMFRDAESFNVDISAWDVSTATNFNLMFFSNGFNQNISTWNMSSAVVIANMFANNTSFNQPIQNWERVGSTLANVTDIRNIFANNTAFNQDISNWNTSSVTLMNTAFDGATAFDQDLGSWSVVSLTNASNMFRNVTLSTANYDSLLIGWEAQAVQNNVTFDGGNSTYTLGGAAETARTNLINDHTWSITDGGGI